MDSGEDVAHDSLVAEIRKINAADRKKSKRAQVKNVRVTRESEIPSFKLGNILSKIGCGETLKKKLQPLVAPLDKPKAKRLQREAGFERVAIDANKWDGIVQERKKADQIHFPLGKVDLRVLTSEKNYKPTIKTDLEKEVYELLQGAKLDAQEKEETEEEKAISKAMSLKEIREKSRKIMMDRNLKMRIERKAALLNKSKSKKYHKILRRERVKRQKEEFERLKTENPSEALEALNELEKTRIKERMDLRHKNSRWLRLQQSRAPHDIQIRDLLKENTEMRQELLEKLKLMQENDKDNSDEEDCDDDDDELNNTEAVEIESKPESSFYKIKQYWESINKQKLTELEALKVVKEYEENRRHDDESIGLQEEKEKEQEKMVEEDESLRTIKRKMTEGEEEKEEDGGSKEKHQIISVSEHKCEAEIVREVSKNLKNKKKNINSKKGNKPVKNETGSEVKCKKGKSKNIEKLETNNKNNSNCIIQNDKQSQNKNSVNKIDENLKMKITFEKREIQNENLNMKKVEPALKEEEERIALGFNKVDRKLGSARHDNVFLKRKLNNEESDSDEEEGLGSIITSSDDYVKEFAEEKKAHEEEMKPKDIDNFKAGWGNWGGPGIVHSETMKKKFRIKAPKARPNKYSHVGNVIYREKCDVHPNLRKNMVSELPFPFTTVKDFEASIRQPIGRTFVPEVSHKKLIAPAVVQKMGTVIEPMDEECLIKHHENYKRIESALEKELDEKLRSIHPTKKRKTEKAAEEKKRRKTNKKKKKNRLKPKPLILV